MEPVELITSNAFSRDELIAALLQVGVEQKENTHAISNFVLRRGEAIVWVDPDNTENYPDPEVDVLIERKLGGPPQTSIILQISRNPGSERLAMELAIRFATRWPAVVDNLSGLARRIFTLEELQDLYDSNLSLHEDAKKAPREKGKYTTDEEYITPERLVEIKEQNRKFLGQENEEEKTFLGFDTPEEVKENVQRGQNTATEGNIFRGFDTSEEQSK